MKNKDECIIVFNGMELDFYILNLTELDYLKTCLVREQRFKEASKVRSLIKVQNEIDDIMKEVNAVK